MASRQAAIHDWGPSSRTVSVPWSRDITVLAQDPAVRTRMRRHAAKTIVRARVSVPAEPLSKGPTGYRIHVVDFDASRNRLYPPFVERAPGAGLPFPDPYLKDPDRVLLRDPRFHALNAYTIAMRTLALFERALGRRVPWGFRSHQLKILPHAFEEPNAYYSPEDEALFFGYFPGKGGRNIYTCLSHDIVAHETAHALLDGLRERFVEPSSKDQAAFHEGFADVVALLSVFSLGEIVGGLLDLKVPARERRALLVSRKFLEGRGLAESVVLGLADEMGSELSQVRGQALRFSGARPPSSEYLSDPAFDEPHLRGEVFVAAVLHALLGTWRQRLAGLDPSQSGWVDRQRVAEEGAEIASSLLTLFIRAIDYLPPVHVTFGDFLSAALTADHEMRPTEGKYRLREALRKSFAAYGIAPAASLKTVEPGLWGGPDADRLSYDRVHLQALLEDREEVFRFIWENRRSLRLREGVFTEVTSVRRCVRADPDGFLLRETVSECLQIATMEARDLHRLGIRAPKGMRPDTEVRLHGGMTLVLSEAGRLKFAIGNRVDSPERQTSRLQHLWDSGFFEERAQRSRYFWRLHRLRAGLQTVPSGEEW